MNVNVVWILKQYDDVDDVISSKKMWLGGVGGLIASKTYEYPNERGYTAYTNTHIHQHLIALYQ